jgi:hypothetical protein
MLLQWACLAEAGDVEERQLLAEMTLQAELRKKLWLSFSTLQCTTKGTHW